MRPALRPIRTVLAWQVIATALLALACGLIWGMHGALSAALGGAINAVAGGIYGWRVSLREARTAGEALTTMFRAWGIKLLLVIVGLWLSLSLYRSIVHAAFFLAFVVTVGVFASAIAVRDADEKQPPPADGGT